MAREGWSFVPLPFMGLGAACQVPCGHGSHSTRPSRLGVEVWPHPRQTQILAAPAVGTPTRLGNARRRTHLRRANGDRPLSARPRAAFIPSLQADQAPPGLTLSQRTSAPRHRASLLELQKRAFIDNRAALRRSASAKGQGEMLRCPRHPTTTPPSVRFRPAQRSRADGATEWEVVVRDCTLEPSDGTMRSRVSPDNQRLPARSGRSPISSCAPRRLGRGPSLSGGRTVDSCAHTDI